MSSENAFWLAVDIMLTKPHVVNKRVWGCRILTRINCKCLNNVSNLFHSHIFKNNDFVNWSDYANKLLGRLELCEMGTDEKGDATVEVIILELLPRNFVERKAYQIAILHKHDNLVNFYDITPTESKQNLCPEFNYSFYLSSFNKIMLKTTDETDTNLMAWIWLNEKVLPQFVKWYNDFENNTEKKQICNDSLVLVASDQYYLKYNELKIKYGKDMVEIWPECTDPSKFVYEDIAIATYILLLWETGFNDKKKLSFVDLGCGNGLLVYILTKEGHKGCGIDVRKRQIWDLYPKDVILEEKSIVPSDTCLFPETDWIIGNHSDELTPWIPVIAARSSYKCNFFLLPCCAYNFDGSKYQRQNSSKSQYSEYLEYVKDLSEKCGFSTQVDRLKIPSTKRICIVGNGRNYAKNQQDLNCSNIQKIIDDSSSASNEPRVGQNWIQNYKTREPVERVRNCTQIDKSVIETIVECIAKYLLEKQHSNEWSAEKCVEISKLVEILPQDKLKCLKSECGGLATLLKNNHHIFKVQSGKVQFRYPKSIKELANITNNKKSKLKIKQRLCWFHKNHPQGCPLSNDDCSFLHS